MSNLKEKIIVKNSNYTVCIEVAEDGENGALVKYETHHPHNPLIYKEQK